MPRLDPAVAAVRRAVRIDLREFGPGETVAVAYSGGTDSLALLAATAWEGARAGLDVVAVHVDHGLRADSDADARRAVAVAAALGVRTDVRRVSVACAGVGLEAAARAGRYEALDAAAHDHGAVALLLGHTADDQAESVLLGLARGAGARSLAGMPAGRGVYRRPLLSITRAQTARSCRVLGLTPLTDPSNEDQTLLRNRVRATVLPLLEKELGPGVAAALTRTARLLRADADLLDDLAAVAWERCRRSLPGADRAAVDVAAVAAEPAAVRSRILRRWLVAAGAPAGALTAQHVDGVDRLVTAWRGQRAVSLPGGLAAVRRSGMLAVEPARPR
ncbi:MAG: tRNA lysidine(34) synthetase TilS [Mycobacteriales bacterium]|nr:tRNA lysidine(34) synthetase TilS [Frankia sp.]